MLRRIPEALSGGYVNTRGASSLEEGELSDGLNTSYAPESLSIHVANATSSVRSVSGASIIGYSLPVFPGVSEFDFLHRASDYAYFNGTTYVALDSVTAGTDMDIASYEARYYVFNGAAANKVLYLNGSTKTMRNHGVSPSTVPPPCSIVAGNWTLTTGDYEYWYTELVDITEGSDTYTLESDFTGTPTVVTVGDTTSGVLVSQPAAFANASAARWRIYRGGPRSSTGVSVYPVGSLIAELDVAVLSFLDGSTANSGYLRPATAATTGTGWSATTGVTSGTQADNSAVTNNVGSGVTLTTYGYTVSIDDPVTGIEVYLRAKMTGTVAFGDVGATVEISQDSGSTWSDPRGVPFGVNNAYLGGAASALCTIGGSTDLWGKASGFWTSTDMGAANAFRVRVTISAPTLFFGTFSIDDVDIKIHYGGSVGNPIGTYPYYSLSIDSGATLSGSMLGAPPASSTGAIFEDSLVVDDTSDKGLIRYTASGLPEYFPAIYYMRLDTARSDSVTCIRAIGNRLVVATTQSIYRINFLPRTFDASFDRGRPIELLSGDLGIPRPSLSCIYTSPITGRPALAFVASDNRIYTTDGYEIRPLCPDLLFTNPWFMVNQPRASALAVFYGGTNYANYRIELQYHPAHIKRGAFLKASPPIELGDKFYSGVASRAGATVSLGPSSSASDVNHVYSTQFGGGSSAFGSSQYVTTRRIWLNGVGNETRINSVFLSDDGTTFAGTYTITPYTSFTNTAEATETAMTKTFSGFSPPVIGFDANVLTEGARYKIAVSASAGFSRWNWAMFEFEDFGKELSGA